MAEWFTFYQHYLCRVRFFFPQKYEWFNDYWMIILCLCLIDSFPAMWPWNTIQRLQMCGFHFDDWTANERCLKCDRNPHFQFWFSPHSVNWMVKFRLEGTMTFLSFTKQCLIINRKHFTTNKVIFCLVFNFN